VEVKLCHGGMAMFIRKTSIQKTCQINRTFKTDGTLTCYSCSFYSICRLQFIFFNATTKETFDFGLLFTEAPCGCVSALSTPHQ